MKLNRLKHHLPERLVPTARLAYRIYLESLFRYTDARDRRVRKNAPPASLRYRVHGSVDLDSFLKNGKRCSQDIKHALGKADLGFDSFECVLDFGCGCGRTLRSFDGSKPRLHGTDIDEEAIRWCKVNLNFADFSTNESLPPLIYADETFDLIYAVSVLTHLDEERQFLWLDELKRITKPGGILLLTVHGEHARGVLPAETAAEVERNGFKFVVSDSMRGFFPDWYQNAFHTREYVLDKFSEYFDIVDYLPRGMNGHQDVVILRKL